MIKPNVSIVCVTNLAQYPVTGLEVLMVNRKEAPGTFGLPGGKLEPGESTIDAAVRELREETDLIAEELHSFYIGFSTNREWLVEAFFCSKYFGVAKSKETEVVWKQWPPISHAGYLGGFYVGCSHAFDIYTQNRSKISKWLGYYPNKKRLEQG